MEFSEHLEWVRACVKSGHSFVPPTISSTDALCAWMALLIELQEWNQLADTVREHALGALWSPTAGLQAAIGLVCGEQVELVPQLLGASPEMAPDALSCFSLAQQICVSGQPALASRWLDVLTPLWRDDWRIPFLRGEIAQAQHDIDQAVRLWLIAASITPKNPVLIERLLTYSSQADRTQAICALSFLMGAVELEGAEHLQQLMTIATDLNQWCLAIWLLDQIAQLQPERLDDLKVRRAFCLVFGQLLDAADAYVERESIPTSPNHFVRFHAHIARRENAAAAALMEELIALDANHADAHYNRAFALLRDGHWREGWEEFEWRFKLGERELRFLGPQSFGSLPVWDGQPTDETVVISSEQGLGDAVQMLRFLPEVVRRVGGVRFELSPTLMQLFNAMEGEGDNPHPDRPDDTATMPAVPTQRVRLMSLPHQLSCPEPQGQPYIALKAAIREKTRDWVAPTGFRVGLVWAGNRAFPLDYQRSPHFLNLLPLADIPGVSFHILQKGPALNQLSYAPPHMHIVRTDEKIEDMADLAGVISHLDLVISMCSMPAHLAGALGVPIWTMLPYNAHYMWEGGGGKTAWYDSMRLFRQPAIGDWKSVVDAIVDALREKLPHLTELSPRPDSIAPTQAGHTESAGPLPLDFDAPIPSLQPFFDILAQDDRHVGAMMSLARTYLMQGRSLDALIWATEATRLGHFCTASWQILHEAMQSLHMEEAGPVADMVNKLALQGAPVDWFGWRC